MQDIAGCRLIFNTAEDLYDFRASFHTARFKHRLLTSDDRYDYIARPKCDGYRGVHDVYQYQASRTGGEPWNKLRIELQYRTVFQHAWATAVEVAGLLTNQEHKFGRAKSEYETFFRVSSEMISRVFEGRNGCLPDLSSAELLDQLESADEKIGLVNLFAQYNNVAPRVRGLGKNTILIFNKRATPEESTTEIKSFDSFSEAVRQLEKLEIASLLDNDPHDIVLVRSVSDFRQGSIESAYRNYFADTKDFVQYVDSAKSTLR